MLPQTKVGGSLLLDIFRAKGISSSKLLMTNVDGRLYTIFTMVHIMYSMMMTSLHVVVQQNCSDIISIMGYLNFKFEH